MSIFGLWFEEYPMLIWSWEQSAKGAKIVVDHRYLPSISKFSFFLWLIGDGAKNTDQSDNICIPLFVEKPSENFILFNRHKWHKNEYMF